MEKTFKQLNNDSSLPVALPSKKAVVHKKSSTANGSAKKANSANSEPIDKIVERGMRKLQAIDNQIAYEEEHKANLLRRMDEVKRSKVIVSRELNKTKRDLLISARLPMCTHINCNEPPTDPNCWCPEID